MRVMLTGHGQRRSDMSHWRDGTVRTDAGSAAQRIVLLLRRRASAFVGSKYVLDTNVDNLPRQHRGQCLGDSRHQRPELDESVRSGMHDNEGDANGPDTLLEHQVPIHRDQVREASRRHSAQEIPVPAAEPALICDRGDREAGKVPTEPLRDALVEQDPHSGRRHPLQQEILSHIERGDGLLAPDTWEVGQELVQRIARLEILDQCLHRDPGADENEGPTHDLGVSVER